MGICRTGAAPRTTYSHDILAHQQSHALGAGCPQSARRAILAATAIALAVLGVAIAALLGLRDARDLNEFLHRGGLNQKKFNRLKKALKAIKVSCAYYSVHHLLNSLHPVSSPS